MKPFTPHEAKDAATKTIPPEMIEAVNQLLAENYSPNAITLTLPQVRERYCKIVSPGMNQIDVPIENHWYDFESLYEKNGWEVKVDAPGYNESYSTRYIFKPKRSYRD